MVIERFANIAQKGTILCSGLEVMEQWENNNFKHPAIQYLNTFLPLCSRVFVRSFDGNPK